jgi:hypothetical protein
LPLRHPPAPAHMRGQLLVHNCAGWRRAFAFPPDLIKTLPGRISVKRLSRPKAQ